MNATNHNARGLFDSDLLQRSSIGQMIDEGQYCGLCSIAYKTSNTIEYLLACAVVSHFG